MKAFVYKGPGQKAFEDRPKPEIKEPGDAIIKVTKPQSVEPICIF